MTTPTPECPACRVTMQEGYSIDRGDKTAHIQMWTEGRPEKGFLGGLKTKNRRQLAMIAYRCPKCGWVIWFAPDAAAE